ncbi:MAG: CCA tRNA nucleotidyltransferase [Clostridia bacterium]|nr:CCA tRNA nucleotidyltransferase [Clostridia bacterium]
MQNIPFEIEKIIDTLYENGYEGFIVGGCVRDILLKKTPHDFDITTNALPENVKAIFPKTVDTGIKHGTVTVITENNTPVEVTTYRTETEYKDMRHPENVVFVGDIKEDLSRRDFTVNALAYNKRKGLIDCFGGENDLNHKILRAVGDPYKRFSEDALRILRLFRFSSTLSFSMENKTYTAALKLCKNLKSISAERVFSELSKLLLGDNPDVLRPLIKNGGLESFGITGNKSLKKLSLLPKNFELRFFAFLEIYGLDFDTVFSKLKVKNSVKKYCETAEKILFLNKKSGDYQIKLALSVCDISLIKDISDYKTVIKNTDISEIYEKAKRIIKSNEPYKISQLALSGNDIKNLGFKDKQVGDVLNILCEAVRKNPKINSPEKLKKAAGKIKL